MARDAAARDIVGDLLTAGSISAETDPTVTTLLARALVESDREARVQEYCDAERQVWNDAPWIFLWTEKFPIVYSSRVAGVASIPTESFDTVHAHPA